jgi:hypothetical protein
MGDHASISVPTRSNGLQGEHGEAAADRGRERPRPIGVRNRRLPIGSAGGRAGDAATTRGVAGVGVLLRGQKRVLRTPVAVYHRHASVAGAGCICGLVSSAAYSGGGASALGGSPVSLASSSLVPQLPPSAKISAVLKARVRSASIRRILSPPIMFQRSTIPDLGETQRRWLHPWLSGKTRACR